MLIWNHTACQAHRLRCTSPQSVHGHSCTHPTHMRFFFPFSFVSAGVFFIHYICMYIHFNPSKLFSWLVISVWRRNGSSMQIERPSFIKRPRVPNPPNGFARPLPALAADLLPRFPLASQGLIYGRRRLLCFTAKCWAISVMMNLWQKLRQTAGVVRVMMPAINR